MKRLVKVLAATVVIATLAGCSIPKNVEEDKNRYSATVEGESYNIVSEVSGKLNDVSISQGKDVKEGDKVAQIDSKAYELQQTQAQAALTIVKAKKDDLPDNAKDSLKDSAQASVDQAQAALELAKLQVEKCTVKASTSGTVVDVFVHKGEIASQGMNIAKIMDLKNKYIKVYIEESKRNDIKLGQNIALYNDNTSIGEGKVIFISPTSEFTPKNTETKEEKEKTVFEVKISVGDIEKAPIGSIIDAEIK